MFMMMIVTTTHRATSNMVNNKYLPSSGNDSDVDGMISEMSKKNIVWDKRIVMHSEIFSLESAGK